MVLNGISAVSRVELLRPTPLVKVVNAHASGRKLDKIEGSKQ